MAETTDQLGVMVTSAAQARLQAARELLVGWPALFRSSLQSVDIGYHPARRLVVAVAHFDPGTCGPELHARFNFWAVHFGGKPLWLTGSPARERTAFAAQLNGCPMKKEGVVPADVPGVLDSLGIGAKGPNRRSNTRFQVELAVDLAGGRASTFDVSEGGVFVMSSTAPPMGDLVPLVLSIPGEEAPFRIEGRVTHVRMTADAKGQPAGFGVSFVSPSEALREAILRHVANTKSLRLVEDRRTHPRTGLRVPVRVTPMETGAVRQVPSPPTTPAPRSSPPSRQELRMDLTAPDRFVREYSENLSMGGAYLRTRTPLPVKTQVHFVATLPDGVVLEADGVVVHTQMDGMGLQLELDARARTLLESALASATTQPRRALIIDDDARMRTLLRDALTGRGFEVLTAPDARAGLALLFDELLLVDVVLTGHRMSGMSGEALISLLRRGGEGELCLVLMTSGVSGVLTGGGGETGADLVVDKSEGPEAVAARVEELVALRRTRHDAG